MISQIILGPELINKFGTEIVIDGGEPLPEIDRQNVGRLVNVL